MHGCNVFFSLEEGSTWKAGVFSVVLLKKDGVCSERSDTRAATARGKFLTKSQLNLPCATSRPWEGCGRFLNATISPSCTQSPHTAATQHSCKYSSAQICGGPSGKFSPKMAGYPSLYERDQSDTLQMHGVCGPRNVE